MGLPLLLAGQSQRDVKEPLIPPACVSVPALLSSPDGNSPSPRDETRLDTIRIQEALDHCAAGRSVRLSVSGDKRAFLSGPIQLRSGVTLVVESGVTLFASREPRDFQNKQGSCGLVDDNGQGCRALITCTYASDAGVMGEGTIDERGGAALLGETYSWWDLAQEARLTSGKVNAPPLLAARGCNRFTLYKISFRNPAARLVTFQDGDGLTVWGANSHTLQSSPVPSSIETANARNLLIINSSLHESAVKPRK